MKDILTAVQRIGFVEEVISDCTIDDDYTPALFGVMFKKAVLKYFDGEDFTDMDIEAVNKKVHENLNQYNLLLEDDLTATQIDELYDACKDTVQQRISALHTLTIVNKPDPLSDFIDVLTDYLTKAKESLGDFDINDLTKLVNKLDGIDANKVTLELAKAKGAEDPKTDK